MIAAAPVAEKLSDPIALHMRTDMARLQVGQSVGEALAAVRQRPPEGRIIYFYVVDEEDRLKGVAPTRRLLLNPLETRIGDIMVRDVVAMPQSATVLDACEFFTLHRLLAFPVVDDQRRLLGIVDVELYTRELTDIEKSERNEELFQLIGVHLSEAQQSSPLGAFRIRFPWLLTNIAGGILAAFLSGLFEAQLKNVVALALFIPVVLALAESVSIQSVSLALQVLRGHRPNLRTILGRLRIEAATGILLGLASGLAVGGVALTWQGLLGAGGWAEAMRVTACLLGGIAGGVTAAAVIGVALPNVLRFFKRDPQVAAGPIALAGADMITLLIYLSLARWLLG